MAPIGARKGRKREVLLRLLPAHLDHLRARAAADSDATMGTIVVDVVAEHVDQLLAGPAEVDRPGGAPPRARARRRHAGGRPTTCVLLTEAESVWLAGLVADTGRSVSDLVDTALGLDLGGQGSR